MDFSEALAALKAGERITRPVWNPDVFITLMPGYPDGIAINAATAKATRLPLGTMVRFHPYILLVEPEGCAQWVHDDDDLLTDDWMIYETSEEATAEILGDPQAMSDIAEAEAELSAPPTDPVFLMVPGLVLGRPLREWRESIADVEGLDGGKKWRVTITGYRDGDVDKVLHYQIEAVPEMDPEVVKETMAELEHSGLVLGPDDENYPVRPQK